MLIIQTTYPEYLLNNLQHMKNIYSITVNKDNNVNTLMNLRDLWDKPIFYTVFYTFNWFVKLTLT